MPLTSKYHLALISKGNAYTMPIYSFFLWTISHPGKNGIPTIKPSDEELCASSNKFEIFDNIITKTFKHYCIPLKATDNIRSIFKLKLWRMGKSIAKLGGPRRVAQLELWKKGEQATWNITINEAEVKSQILRKRKITEDKLQNEITKRRKLQSEVEGLKTQVIQQEKEIAGLKYGNPILRRPKKSWSQSSRQSQHKKKKKITNKLLHVTSFCEDNGFKLHGVELENTETGIHEAVDLSTGKFVPQVTGKNNDIHSTLYIKDKYSISDTSYHELSILSDLPSSKKVQRLRYKLNLNYSIKKAPANIIRVQQSLKEQLIPCITNIINNIPGDNIPSCFHIKLTGDGTQIGRGFTIVNFAFTILEEGDKAHSAAGNHSLGIFKVCESDYSALHEALQDIISEANHLKHVIINSNTYNIEYYLGGDMKFLALVCGIESANSTHSCIWCKCPKNQRHQMDVKWSISDTKYGARTIEEISTMSQLSKSNKNRYNCNHKPMFPFIPIHHVIIDSLHLFLRIADILINLLIRDIRILDEQKKSNIHIMQYQQFLNDECKVHFKFQQDKETKTMKWRDLTGPEKKRLFEHIDIPALFPSLENSQKIQKLWNEFVTLVKCLSVSTKESQSPQDFDKKAKQWVNDFRSVYQCKDVTPYYMHCLAMHVSQFLEMYGNIGQFTQQGLEKLNDLTTIFFSMHQTIMSKRHLNKFWKRGTD